MLLFDAEQHSDGQLTAILGTWHSWMSLSLSTSEWRHKAKVRPENEHKLSELCFSQFFWKSFKKLILDWQFKIHCDLFSAGEKWLRVKWKTKQFHFSRHFSGVMPLVYLDCFSRRRAIYSLFHQLVATCRRHGDNELIKNWLLFSSSVRKKKPIPHHQQYMSDLNLSFSESL